MEVNNMNIFSYDDWDIVVTHHCTSRNAVSVPHDLPTSVAAGVGGGDLARAHGGCA